MSIPFLIFDMFFYLMCENKLMIEKNSGLFYRGNNFSYGSVLSRIKS